MLKTLGTLSLFVAVVCAPARAAIREVPEKVEPAVHDVQMLPTPDQVHLTGMLGARIDGNERNRLLNVDEDVLLAGFRKRPGQQAWVGEHVGKWLHAATLAWVYTGDARLREKLDRVAAELIKTQDPDGYLGTYLEKDRWTSWDVWVHKYDLIGLLTYYRFTGDESAIAACRKVGDLLCATFGKDKRDIIAAGKHVGMAATSVLEPMVLLYRTTGEKKYLEFCEYILWAWEQPHGPKLLSSLGSGKGVNQTANAKAYEMLSNLVGLCELYRTTGQKDLLPPVVNAWKDIVDKRLYISGSASQKEHFHEDYLLPNTKDQGLMETCVTVTWMQMNLQLLRLTGEARYGDQLERTIYNQLSSAQSPTGDDWCYFTSLEGTKPYSKAKNQFNCCLSSGPRGMALIPTFAFTTEAKGVVVNVYETSKATLRLADGAEVVLEQKTNYPFSGESILRIGLKAPKEFSLLLRNLPWVAGQMRVTGGIDTRTSAGRIERGYLVRSSLWKDGDEITVQLPLPLRIIEGDHTNENKIALMRGPLLLAASDGVNPKIGGTKNVSLPNDLKALNLRQVPMPASVVAERENFQWQVSPCKTGVSSGQDASRLVLSPLSMAGADGSYFQVWFSKCDTKNAVK